MASLDKTSVRGEISRVKADCDQLCAEDKVPGELKVIMSSLFMIVELLLSIFLERQTRKDNKHSSMPSSQTDQDDSSLTFPGAKGKGKHENGTVAGNTRTQTSVSIAAVDCCDACGEVLSDVPVCSP